MHDYCLTYHDNTLHLASSVAAKTIALYPVIADAILSQCQFVNKCIPAQIPARFCIQLVYSSPVSYHLYKIREIPNSVHIIQYV